MRDDTGKVKETIEAVEGIVKAIPIYQDVLQPAAVEVGKGLETLAKTIHVALAPVSALVWGYDQIKDFVSTRVAEKLMRVPQDQICTPDPMVAGPTLEALRYAGHEPTLRELYANLLATALNSYTSQNAHPAFVEIVKQLTPLEAKLIQLFVKQVCFPLICSNYTQLSPSSESRFSAENAISHIFCVLCGKLMQIEEQIALTSLDNLRRLQLLEMTVYNFQKLNERRIMTLSFSGTDSRSAYKLEQEQRAEIRFTAFGVNFINSCVTDAEHKLP